MLTRRFTFLVFLLALVQFCLFLNHRDITNAHEGRVAATSREMLARHEWLIPYCNDMPRVAKPPLAYWTTMVGWSIAGSSEPWIARLPAALLGAIAVLLMMDLGRRVLGNVGGVICGLVWVSTHFIVDSYRNAMADPYLAFFTLLSVWAWVTADQQPEPRRGRANWLILLCYVSAGAGALAKGHLILLSVGVALIPYQLLRRRRPAGSLVTHIAGVMLCLLIALPWPLYMLLKVPGTAERWSQETTGSYATNGPRSDPWYQYLINLPLTAAPWTIFFFIGLLTPFLSRLRSDRRHLWTIVWLGLTVLIFTLVPMKKNAYLLPSMPAQTLIIAAAIASILRNQNNNRREKPIDRFLIAAHAVAAGIAVCVVLYLSLSIASLDMERPGALLAAGGVVIFLLVSARSLSSRLLSLRTVALIALGFALSVHGVVSWITPDLDNRWSAAPFALSVNATVDKDPIYLMGTGIREDVLFYLGRTLPVIESLDQLPPDYHGYALVRTEQYGAVRLANRSDKVAMSTDRREKDRLYLVRFPKNPNPPVEMPR